MADPIHFVPVIVPVTKLRAVSYNPTQRTQKVADLEASIQEVGQLEPIHVVRADPKGTFTIVEGHRRAQALLNLGQETAKVIVHDAIPGKTRQETVDTLYREFNKPRMSLKGTQQLQAALKGGPVFNSRVNTAFRFIMENFNPLEREALLAKNVGPEVVNIAKRIARYVGSTDKNFLSFARKTLFWLLRRQTQNTSVLYMRRAYSHQKLREAIEHDRAKLPFIG